jgi:hypothetical protein
VGVNDHGQVKPAGTGRQISDVGVSGGMKVIFFGRFEIHDFFGGFSSAASLKKVLLHRVDFLPS